MKHIVGLCLVAAFSINASPAHSTDFREAPPRMQDAEAQGLARVDAKTLATLLHGPVEFSGESYTAKQRKSLLVFNPDGTVERRVGDSSFKGEWSIDNARNVYCTAFTFQKRGLEKNCFAVFRSPDGIHYFDYDLSKGFRVHVWRPATKH